MNARRQDTYTGVWTFPGILSRFLRDVRGAIPHAADQLSIMLRLLAASRRPLRRILDLGAGDGLLTEAVLVGHPKTRAVLVDLSEAMLDAAKCRLRRYGSRVTFLKHDLGRDGWINDARRTAPFDAVVSGFAIHHLPDSRKHRLYRQVFSLLAKGGIFVNIEHVAPLTP